MFLDIESLESTGGNCYPGAGYFVGGNRYGAFFGIPFKNNKGYTITLKSLTLPLGYWNDNGNARTVQGAVWLLSRGPVDSSTTINTMDLYSAASDNLSSLRNNNSGSVSGSRNYKYWYSPWQGLGSADKQKVLNAMIFSNNTCTPTDGVDRDTQARVTEHTFYFNDIEIPPDTYFYVGIYGSESACDGSSIAIRRLGYSSPNRNGSLDQKYYYDRSTMVAANYVTDYRGRWHFYNGYFTNTNHPNNYAQGPVDAKITVELPYDTPTISITTEGGTTKNTDTVTVNYGANEANRKGSTYVQYSVNGSSWNTISGSGNDAGSFSYVPSSFGVGLGNGGYTVKVRRILTSIDFGNVSNEPSITMKTYGGIGMTGFKLSPASVVNANTRTTLTWDKYDSSETTTCKIEILNSGGSVISILASSLANSTTTLSFTPSNNIGIAYDNSNVTIRITRTGATTGYTASQSLSFKILYTPTDKVTNITPSNLGVIKEDKSITWGYPTNGYKGIVSGYNIKLTGSNGNTVNYYASTNNVKLRISDINPAVWYRISIRAYYTQNSNYYYGSYNEISDYLYYDKGISSPTISYPINSSWVGNSYRVIFQLPEDYNYDSLSQAEKDNYRYHDVEVVLNNKVYSIKSYPSAFSLTIGNLTHRAYIVFAPSVIGIQANSSNTVKVRVLSYFDTWSGYSNTITMKNISNAEVKNIGDIIYFDDYNKILSVAQALCKSYGISFTSSSKKGSLIVPNDINNVYSKLLEMKNKVNNNYTYNNQGVKFRDISPIIVSKGDIIRASHFASLVSMISILTT